MRLLHVTRAAAACTMLTIVFMVLSLGAACQARCIHSAGARGCCPTQGSSVDIVGMATCLGPVDLSSVSVISTALVGIDVSGTVVPTLPSAAPEMQHRSVRGSPPGFHLRI